MLQQPEPMILTRNPKKKSKKWTKEETMALLTFYKARQDEFSFVRKRWKGFANIVNDMVAAGFDREITIRHCEIKMHTLLRAYRIAKENPEKRTSLAPYLTELDEIFAEDENKSKSQGATALEAEYIYEYVPPSDYMDTSSSMSASVPSIDKVFTVVPNPSDLDAPNIVTNSNFEPSIADLSSNSLQCSQPKKNKAKNQSQSSLLSIKRKKLMLKRIELLNHKTTLEIALLEKQLGVPSSSYTANLTNDPLTNGLNTFVHEGVSSHDIKQENHNL